MAPLAAIFDSLRRMECSTSSAGERLKCVRPSLSNSATSLTCIVVAMGNHLLKSARKLSVSQNELFSLKSDALAKETNPGSHSNLEERYCCGNHKARKAGHRLLALMRCVLIRFSPPSYSHRPSGTVRSTAVRRCKGVCRERIGRGSKIFRTR